MCFFPLAATVSGSLKKRRLLWAVSLYIPLLSSTSAQTQKTTPGRQNSCCKISFSCWLCCVRPPPHPSLHGSRKEQSASRRASQASPYYLLQSAWDHGRYSPKQHLCNTGITFLNYKSLWTLIVHAWESMGLLHLGSRIVGTSASLLPLAIRAG